MKNNDVSNFVLLCLIIIWTSLLLTNCLYNSMLVGNVVSDVFSAQVTVNFNVVIEKDATPPTIISTIINPYDPVIGDNVFLNLSATDNIAVDGKFANITLPNGSIVFLPLPANYTVQLGGKHDITFFVNDTSGNTKTITDFFIAGTSRKNITFNVVNHNLEGILANFTVYLPNTNQEVDQKNFIGKMQDQYINIFYDLYYKTWENTALVRLKGIFIFTDDNNTFGVDRYLPESDFLVTYGFYTDYNIDSAEATISYANTSYTDESLLNLYKCNSWNFITRTCPEGWIVFAATQNKFDDTFTFTTTSFSAFSIKQESTPILPSPTGGGLGKAISTPKEVTPKIGEEIPGEKEKEKVKVPEEKPIEKKEEEPKEALIKMPNPEIIIGCK
ncbi:MAG: hypothetical protein KJ597_05275, partial [Nanoarchaeota archaeon]|nr:hypothetical protein [Nanoarchaeota archaeon]